MFKKLTAVVALLTVIALGAATFAPPASAEEPGEVFLRGSGVLDAEGRGIAAVKGAMDYEVSAEEGVLLVKDLGGQADIEVEGYGGMAEWNGFVLYWGFKGRAHIIGRDVAVIVVGEGINLHVAGKGWAYLKGYGSFSVNGRGPLRWDEEGGFAGLGAPTP